MSARHEAEGLKYGVRETVGTAETLELSASGLGQRNPQHYAYPAESHAATPDPLPTLGPPLTIHEVAEILGCSPWTVRQRHLPQGLPHLRASARGKIVFFRQQVIAWIEKRQRQKGGPIR